MVLIVGSIMVLRTMAVRVKMTTTINQMSRGWRGGRRAQLWGVGNRSTESGLRVRDNDAWYAYNGDNTRDGGGGGDGRATNGVVV